MSTRPAFSCSAGSGPNGTRSASRSASCARRFDMPWTRNDMAARAARELRDGFYVHLGIGIPTLVADNIPFGMDVTPQRSEEHTSELQLLIRISYTVFCLKKK